MMNFAYAKNGEVWIRGAGGDGGDMKLNEYIFDVLQGDKYYCEVDHPDDVPEFCLDACFCELGALFAAATQAAELRARLAAYEDTGLEPEQCAKYAQADIEGRLLVLPCKVGDVVFLLFEKRIHELRVQGISVSASGKDAVLHFGGYPTTNAWVSGMGRTFFLTREEAEAALKVGGEDG